MFKNVLLFAGMSTALAGCVFVDRTERFVRNFEKTLVQEYTRRSDPNTIAFGGRYAAIQKIGELQRQVYMHQISIREAKQQVQEEEYTSALDAVQAIARGAAQDAFQLSNPEVNVIENLPTIGTLSLAGSDEIRNVINQNDPRGRFSANEDFSDILRPRFRLDTNLSDLLKPNVSLDASIGKDSLNLVPSFQLGRLYSITYETKNETYDHELRYRYQQWAFRVDLKHTEKFQSVHGMIIYNINGWTSMNVQHTYKFQEKEHVISFGFAKQF